MKLVCQLNDQGYFVGMTEADESPLEPGVYHLPGGTVDAQPPIVPPGMRALWTGSGWSNEPGPGPAQDPSTPKQPSTVEEAQAQQIGRLSESCRAQIVSGFASSALGTEHHYPAQPTDQINLAGSVLDSLLPGLAADWTTPFWCQDAAGLWALVPHTATQIQQVGRDGKAAIVAAITRNESLAAQVRVIAASPDATVADVLAVVW